MGLSTEGASIGSGSEIEIEILLSMSHEINWGYISLTLFWFSKCLIWGVGFTFFCLEITFNGHNIFQKFE